MLTTGNVDVRVALTFLERAGHIRHLLGNKGYNADQLPRLTREAGPIPIIPGRGNRKRAIRYNRKRYADRHLIENAIRRSKGFRHIATPYDRRALNCLSGSALEVAIAF